MQSDAVISQCVPIVLLYMDWMLDYSSHMDDSLSGHTHNLMVLIVGIENAYAL